MNDNLFAESVSCRPAGSRCYVNAHFPNGQVEQWMSVPRRWHDVVCKAIATMGQDPVLTRRLVAQWIGRAIVAKMPRDRENQKCTVLEQDRIIEYVRESKL